MPWNIEIGFPVDKEANAAAFREIKQTLEEISLSGYEDGMQDGFAGAEPDNAPEFVIESQPGTLDATLARFLYAESYADGYNAGYAEGAAKRHSARHVLAGGIK